MCSSKKNGQVVNTRLRKRCPSTHNPKIKSFKFETQAVDCIDKLQLHFVFCFKPHFAHWLLHKPVHALNISCVSSGLYYTNLRDTCQHLLGSHCESVPGAALCECWRGDSSVRPRGLWCLSRDCPRRQLDRGGKTQPHNPHKPFLSPPAPPPPSLPARRRKWALCERQAALIFMYTFFFPPFFSQHIMTPDYVTTGFVSDCSETRRN